MTSSPPTPGGTSGVGSPSRAEGRRSRAPLSGRQPGRQGTERSPLEVVTPPPHVNGNGSQPDQLQPDPPASPPASPPAGDHSSRRSIASSNGGTSQRTFEFLALRLAPALAAAAITVSHENFLLEGVIVLVSMLIVSSLVRRASYPMHLMPLASATRYLIVTPLGLAFAVLVMAADASSATRIGPSGIVAPCLGALLITGLGTLFASSFRSRAGNISIGVIGSADFASVLVGELDAIRARGYRVLGHIDIKAVGPHSGENSLGDLSQLRSIVLKHRIELLVLGPLAAGGDDPGGRFIASGASRLEVFERVADACLDLPVSMIDSPQFYEEVFGHVPLGTTNSAWFAYLLHPRYRATSPFSKRLLDLVGGSIAAVLLAPVILVAAAAIRISDPGPIFHRQRRIGEKGDEIEVLKLRTMRPGADGDGPMWSSADDDRITPVGRVLRRLHVDELPQLWLVLKGEMSLVGPRPEQPAMVGELEAAFPYYDRRHLVKPGITGWAQVRCGYAGSHIGTAWKLCHDLYYLKRRSMMFDLLILVETLARVFVPEPIARPDQRLIVAMRADAELLSR